MEVTILIKGTEKKRVYHGVELIKDSGGIIHIHGFYEGVSYDGGWCKSDIIFIDVLFFRMKR